MKNSKIALLFIRFFSELKKETFVLSKFLKDNDLNIDVLCTDVLKGEKVSNDLYLHWVNDFITVQAFADYYSFTLDEANEFLDTYRKVILNKNTD